MRYRICNNVASIEATGRNDIYRKFKYQFDQLFTADEIPTTDAAFEKIYVADTSFEADLENFLNSNCSIATFCVGYTGIGKTTTLRHFFELGIKNVVKIGIKSKGDPSKQTIVFPTFLDGALKGRKKNDLERRISAVCAALEKDYPYLRQITRTQSGKQEFISFIEQHSPEILESLDDSTLSNLSDEEEISYKLKYAQTEFPFAYFANKLKFYIRKEYRTFDRLVIILDDLEALPHAQQNEAIEEYLKLFTCMKNTEYSSSEQYYIKLLISIRPHTLRLYQNCEFSGELRRLQAYGMISNPVLKKSAVKFPQLFKKRFDYYTTLSQRTIGNKDAWDECYKNLIALTEAFSGKYVDMICNLCFLNIRDALAEYSKIFANRFWVQSNQPKESSFSIYPEQYIFNNISVIRAIGCNNMSVFTGSNDSIIPNFFLSSEEEDNSIYCLVVMQYFILDAKRLNPENTITYGQNTQKLGEIRKKWRSVVGSETEARLYKALVHLFNTKLLRKSIDDVDDSVTIDTEASLNDESKLYVSPRGLELMEMLKRDSVLFEMLRECSWREYDGHPEYSMLSSYELLREKQQRKIFLDLLEYINYLREEEQKIFSPENQSVNLVAYSRIFGHSMAVDDLLLGVEKSLQYSGLINDMEISRKFWRVKKLIQEENGILKDKPAYH